MRKIFAAAIFLASCIPAIAFGPAQRAGHKGVTYYVAAAGSDSNSGTQADRQWATTSKVSGRAFHGYDIVKFHGGDTFSTSTIALTAENNPSGHLSLTTYGSGQPTISSGNSSECVKATNVAAVGVNNIICTGGGNATNTTAGISIINSQAGNTKLAGPTITNTTISGYGGNGIEAKGTAGTSGFNGIVLANNTIHDVTGNSVAAGLGATGSAAINVFSTTGYGSGTTTPSHTNIQLSNIVVYNATGVAGATTWTGSGIVVSEASGVTGQNLLVHDFGANSNTSAGPCGVWTFDATAVHYLKMEIYNGGSSGTGGSCGVDLDGGVTNSIIEQFWAHDNNGPGALLFTYNDGTIFTQSNNVMRDFIVQNNMRNGPTGGGEVIIGASTGGTITNPQVYNFTCYAGVSGVCLGQSTTGTIAGTNARVNNAILYGVAGLNLINMPTPGTLKLDGNDYFGSPDFSWNGSNYTTYAAWISGSSQESVNGGHTFNPQIYVPGGGFVTSGYAPTQMMAYNPQAGAAVISAGINLQTQFGINPGTTDFFGTAVTAATLPIGAGAADFVTFAASCAQATTFLALTSSFTKLDNVNYNSWLCGSASDGDLALMDIAYLLAAPNHAAMLLDVSGNSHSLTEHGTVTFTARTGIASNGTTGYEDTGWVPSAGPNYTLNSVTTAGYDLSNPGANGNLFLTLLGAGNAAATSETSLIPGPNSGFWYCDANDETGVSSAGTTAAGFSMCQRTASNAIAGYKNGALAHANVTASTLLVTGANMLILASSNYSGGMPGGFLTDTVSSAFVGGSGISPLNTSLRANSFMKAYGVNVY